MLINTVIIILQEVLEAALLVSILMAISRYHTAGFRWLAAAGFAGLFGALLFQHNLATISSAFDDVGQEVTNALLQIAVFASLLPIASYLDRTMSSPDRLLLASMGVAVSLSIIREGSEIIIYLGSALQIKDRQLSIFLGASIGMAIGASIAALLFFGVSSLQSRWRIVTIRCLVALISASMLSQAVQQLLQADWLPAHTPIWDSSGLIGEESIAGRLLYAIAGYEARPDILQAAAFLAGFVSILLASRRKAVN